MLEINNVCLIRNDISVISDFSLNIYSSSVTNIYGRNGSGKTSLLKCLHSCKPAESHQLFFHSKTKIFLRNTFITSKTPKNAFFQFLAQFLSTYYKFEPSYKIIFSILWIFSLLSSAAAHLNPIFEASNTSKTLENKF